MYSSNSDLWVRYLKLTKRVESKIRSDEGRMEIEK